MPNTKQSKTAKSDVLTLLFVEAFCRRNLSLSEIQVISDIFDVMMADSLKDESLRAQVIDLMNSIPQIDTRTPRLSQDSQSPFLKETRRNLR